MQENAYKQYLKSRPLASTSSVRSAKNIRLLHPVLGVHPIFSKKINKNLALKLNDSKINLINLIYKKENNQDYKASGQHETNLLDKLKSFVTKSVTIHLYK